MAGDLGVVVLLQNPTAQVSVPRDHDLPPEVQEAISCIPLSVLSRLNTPNLEELPSCERNGVLKVQFAS